ncbi:hypothetical protein Asi02nite_00100 [Asanoa siamensis]|uniref:Uncharacterized protein n=1 Tax=Asanoa siamensis TaxID=926357 RepID=A0ABQ4CI55_9ACTN|nr:hypothetical protein Asi02nite_00100 [Asanoa siamensis]
MLGDLRTVGEDPLEEDVVLRVDGGGGLPEIDPEPPGHGKGGAEIKQSDANADRHPDPRPHNPLRRLRRPGRDRFPNSGGHDSTA